MVSTQFSGLGAIYLGDNRCSFCVWAPRASNVEIHIVSPDDRYIRMNADERGYHRAIVEGVSPGVRYFYRLDGEKERADPASRSQPDGVHSPSQVVDPSFDWRDSAWVGLPLQDYIVYEMHVGAFTEEGTFDAVIPHLETLKDLGITAIEIMPVAQFPGSRNWGYDGVYLYAAQESYGGAAGLKRLVNACHAHGLAVVLDVVYNHLGPEGNYLWDYGYYFTDRYQTPWGAAVNFDGDHSDEVRRFFIENTLMWIDEFHMDALRLDAVHAIKDFSAYTFLQELSEAVQHYAERSGRRIYTIAESDLNDPRHLNPPALGGYGLDSQWSDDFHHVVHTLLTGEQSGYYEDFGAFHQLVRVYREGWVFAGDYSPHRQRRHGGSARSIASGRLVVCTQNHDQVGNRMLGDRLTTLVSFDALKLAAATLLLSPFIPMLFMGEEYGEPAPFLYFVNHGDPDLVEAVRRGRKAEFSSFAWKGEPPDPQAEETLAQSRLNHALREQGKHQTLATLYRELIRLRKTLPALAMLSKEQCEVTGFDTERVMMVRRWAARWSGDRIAYAEGGAEVVTLFNYQDAPVTLSIPLPSGVWSVLLNTAEARWQEHPDAAAVQTLPDTLTSPGQVTVTLPPYAAVLWSRGEVA
jgi:maltooligosyltrehalose trehalohydrolase